MYARAKSASVAASFSPGRESGTGLSPTRVEMMGFFRLVCARLNLTSCSKTLLMHSTTAVIERDNASASAPVLANRRSDEHSARSEPAGHLDADANALAMADAAMDA